MRNCLLIVLGLLLACCAGEKTEDQPVGPWIYPIVDHGMVLRQAARPGEEEICRLVGWDKDFYYFDWAQENLAIGRGTGRVDREDFDHANGASLMEEKGEVTARGGQVRNVRFVE